MNISRSLTSIALTRGEVIAFPGRTSGSRYADVEQRVESLASGLQSLGLERGDRVAILTQNSPEMIEIFYAVWRAGGAVVPLNIQLTPDEVRFHLADSGSRIMFVSSDLMGAVPGSVDAGGTLKHVVVVGAGTDALSSESMIQGHQDRAPRDPGTDDGDLAWLMYTSGTTGRPKGAMLTHGNLAFITLGMIADMIPVKPGEVGLHAAPLTHGAGFLALAYVARGATHAFLGRFSGEAFLEAVDRLHVKYVWLVPTQIRAVLKSELLGSTDLSSLRRVVYGGSPISPKDLHDAVDRIGPVFVQLWAQAETAMTGTYLPVEDHVGEHALERASSCGRSRTLVEVAVLDDDGEICRPGDVGEMCVRGPSVMKGYWCRDDETNQTIRDGWLHTGDVGRCDGSGYFYLLDRSKDVIISGGLNVYPREVESVVGAHSLVDEVCVVGVPHEYWGEAVKAVVVRRPGSELTEKDVMAYVRGRLAPYKRPKSVEFVPELPKNSYGKVLRREIRAPYWAGHERAIN